MKTPSPSLASTLAALALAAAVLASGCKSSPAPANNAPADSANAPASSANAPSGSAAAPAPATPNGSAPAGSAATSTPPAPQPKPAPQKITLTVAPGVDIHARINESINSKTANVGDSFSGELLVPLKTKGGEIVFAKGTPVSGHVVAVREQGRFKGAGVLGIELNEIGGKPVTASEYVVSKKGKGKRSAALIGGGAGAGALIGGLAGGGKGALIGGLIGGGAGTAGAGLTGNKPLLIPSESEVVFELSQPLSKTIER